MKKYVLTFTIILVCFGLLIEASRDAETKAASLETASLQIQNSSVLEVCPVLKSASYRLSEDVLMDLVEEASAEYSLDKELILAVIAAESRCKSWKVSHRGAVGLMQLMPATATWLGVNNPHANDDNVMGGAKYLSYLLKEFKGDMHLALAAYNAGPGTVKRNNNAVPPYKETKHYVKRVMNYYNKFRAEKA